MDTIEVKSKEVLVSNLNSSNECTRKSAAVILANAELFRMFCIAVKQTKIRDKKLK